MYEGTHIIKSSYKKNIHLHIEEYTAVERFINKNMFCIKYSSVRIPMFSDNFHVCRFIKIKYTYILMFKCKFTSTLDII